MDIQELNQMFDRLSPTPEQEDTLLNALQHPERKGTLMKKRRVCAAVLASAVLLAGVCTAAVATHLDIRLLDYFGAALEDEKVVDLLSTDAIPADVTVTDNGATLHVTQVLRDRYSLVVLADFTAPEGTVLEPDGDGSLGFGFQALPPTPLDKAGHPTPLDKAGHPISCSSSWSWTILDDGDPQDNHLSIVFSMNLFETGVADLSEASTFWLAALNVNSRSHDLKETVIYPGNWSCEIPLPQRDFGWSQPVSVIELSDGMKITPSGELYLSPITLQLALNWSEQDTKVHLIVDKGDQRMELTARDGQTIPLESGAGSIDIPMDQDYTSYHLTEVIDPAKFQGGTLTFWTDDQAYYIHLDDLKPVEP